MVESVGAALGVHRREVALIGILVGCTFTMVALLGHQPADPTILHPGPRAVENPCGPVGASLAALLFFLFGHGAWATFGAMVLTVLALAGRPTLDGGQSILGAGLGIVTLGILELLLGPAGLGSGGIVGRSVAAGSEMMVGTVGAWLLLGGVAVMLGTWLFRIRWGRVASTSVGMGEQAIVWSGRRAGGWLFRPVVRSGRRLWARLADPVDRMGRSITRREPEDPDPWRPRTPHEDGAGPPPATLAEIGAADPEASQRNWDLGRPRATSEILGLFPALTPRVGRPSPSPEAVSRDAPTRPSVRPRMLSGNTPGPVSEAPRSLANPHGVRAPRAGAPRGLPALPPPLSQSGDTQPAAPRPLAPAGPPPVGANVQRSPFLDQLVVDDGGVVGSQPVGGYRLPTLGLLDPVPDQHAHFDRDELQRLAKRVEETLASFKVTGQVTDVRVGPVVTTFEFLPGPGISVRRIANLQDDLAMALRALSVRIVAPIPGKGVVGIEIPSANRLTIYLREMMACDAFRDADMALPVVLGKDVEGAPVVVDLARMPHLLVGGTTGSGKSVGVNGMLMSLLFTRTPDELRLLLVDPKKLEFRIYEGIPHLLHPVVTDAKAASAALAWACREMDDRYDRLARWDCRNIDSYNRKVQRERRDWTAAKADHYGCDVAPGPLPYIVVVIDELADLMLVAKKEVEGSIARLTQMARACGIHLIVATQRPSVDVITGLIKSNLPTRISFKLRSGVDSRTILDATGADALLGRGDMLYLPNAGDLMRVHGAFASDEETGAVMDFLRAQGAPAYVEGVTADPSDGRGPDDEEVDPLYHDAELLCVSHGKASTSMIQRHLKIGYNRAARIVDQLEARGVVGPADGARPREVLVSGIER